MGEPPTALRHTRHPLRSYCRKCIGYTLRDYSSAQWHKMVEGFAKRLHITQESNVLEMGCGSGAFLFTLREVTGCKVTGVDYSPPQIETAKKFVEGDFFLSEAAHIPSEANAFDMVFAHSVFQYFPSLRYAYRVIGEATRVLKRGGLLCLMDLIDQEHEHRYQEDRRDLSGDNEAFEKKYKNLPHLFFDRTLLTQDLAMHGFNEMAFFPHDVEDYVNRHHRFNLMARKTSNPPLIVAPSDPSANKG